MSPFICSTQATNRWSSRGQLGSRTLWTATPASSSPPGCPPGGGSPTPRVSTSTLTPCRTSASASLRTWRASPPSMTGGYSQERSSTRLLMPETLSRTTPHGLPVHTAHLCRRPPRRKRSNADQLELVQPARRGRGPHIVLG